MSPNLSARWILASAPILLVRIALVLVLGALAGCASTAKPRTDDGLDLSTFYMSYDYMEARWDGAPLIYTEVIVRLAEQSVPIIQGGTAAEDIRRILEEHGLEPISTNSGIFVYNLGRFRGFGPQEPTLYFYEIGDGVLFHGPITEDELVARFLRYDLDGASRAALRDLNEIKELSASSFNNIAWALATFHDPTRRDGEDAVRMAIRANELSEYKDSYHLDTLAAAYAASGKFKQAVIFQKLAHEVADPVEPDMLERLEMYENGTAYYESVEVSRGMASDPMPDDVWQRAAEGDGESMWLVAVYCIENHLWSADDCDNRAPPEWIELSAATGFDTAVEEMGFLYLHGEMGYEQDNMLAEQWLTRAVANGSDLAAYNLGILYRDGLTGNRNDAKATEFLALAADRGVAQAALEVGYRLRNGVGSEVDLAGSDKYFSIAAEGKVDAWSVVVGEYQFAFEGVYNNFALERLPPFELSIDDFPEYLVDTADSMLQQRSAGAEIIRTRFPQELVGWDPEDVDMAVENIVRGAARFGSRRAQTRLISMLEAGDTTEVSEGEADYWRQQLKRQPVGPR